VEQEPALEVPPRRAQPLRVPAEPDRVALDALQHPRGKHDPLARDLRQDADLDRQAAVHALAHLDDAPAEDVVLGHQLLQLGEQHLGLVALGSHQLQGERAAHPVVVGAQQRDGRAGRAAQEHESARHADDLAVRDRDRGVLDRPGKRGRPVALGLHELGDARGSRASRTGR